MTDTEEKYFAQRFRLWSRYDEGVVMDKESWYSVTPEAIAGHIAKRSAEVLTQNGGRPRVVLDAFCGAGGNAIQFAKYFDRVIAVDIDPEKIALARKNAAVYGVEKKIEFQTRDFFEASKTVEADVVFLAPPWGGPLYHYSAYYDLADTVPSTLDILKATSRISANIVLYLPRHARAEQLTRMAKKGDQCEVEHNLINGKCKSLTAYYGLLIDGSKTKLIPKEGPTVASLCVSKRQKLV